MKGLKMKATAREKVRIILRMAEFMSTALHNLAHELLYCLLHLFMLMAPHAVQIKEALESN